MLLLLRALFWTILMPGTVTIYVPYRILSHGEAAPPTHWGLWQWLALPVAALGAVILLHCIVAFATVGRGTLSPLDAPHHLVVRGLYRYVRNPMYWGVLLILLSEALFFASVPLLEYAAGCPLLVHLFVVLYEEPHLRRRFGDSYALYCQAVHRWLPGKPYD